MNAIELHGTGSALRLRHEVEYPCGSLIEVCRADCQEPAIGACACDAARHVYSDVFAYLALQSGHLGERHVVWQEVQDAACFTQSFCGLL